MRRPKFKKLGFRDWWRIAISQVALVRAWIEVRTRPQGELVAPRAEGASAVAADAADLPKARQVALGISRAATYGIFEPTCLVRSIALRDRLAAEDLPGAQLRVGVAKRRGRFVAHAWVEYAGEVVGDDSGVGSRYATLDDLQVNPRA